MSGFNDPGARQWTEDEFQVSTHTGNVAWAMLGLLAYYRWAGGDKYLNAIERMGEWVETNCRDTRGAGGYTGGFDGGEPAPKKRFYKATEHNIDLVAAFHQLFIITGNEKWRERANHAKRFVLAMWDDAERKFWTGTGENGVTIGKDVIPVDIQAWAILALAEESRQYWGALEYAEKHHKVGEGYDFNQDRDGVWHEGTAQMAAAYHYTGNRERRLAILNYLKQAQLITGGIYATDVDSIRCSATNIYCGLTTGFTLNNGEPWFYFRRLHVGATAWQALAEQGVNPFRITRSGDTVAISGRVTEANGPGISGVAVKLSGSESDVTLTDNDGTYSFVNLLKGGSYTVTPSKALSSYAPKSAAFNNINGAQTASFTSVPLPIITSIKPVYALQGSVVSNFVVTGVNLTGSAFSFAPTPSAIRVDSATVNPQGASATLRLTVSLTTFGPLALVATNSAGRSEESLLPANTLWILDPRLDTDGDGFPDGVEIEIGSNPLDECVTPLTIALPFTEVAGGFFSILNTTDLRVELNEAVGTPFSILNLADPSQAPSPDPGALVNEAIGATISILNLADPSQTPPGAPPDANVFVGETASPPISIRNTIATTGNSPSAGRPEGESPDKIPPNVTLSVPLVQTSLLEGETITIKADARDNKAVKQVVISVNGADFLTDSIAPYELKFTVPAGVRSLIFSATAEDSDGNVGYAEDVAFPVIPDRSATIRGRVVDSWGNPVKGATVIAEQNGLTAEFYEIETPLQPLPDLIGRTPGATKLVSAVNIRNPYRMFGRDPFGSELSSMYAARFTGRIRIAAAGAYQFIIGTCGIARLRIDGADLIDIPAATGDFQEASGSMTLPAGMVPIEVLYFNPAGNHELQLSYITPDGERQVAGPEILFPSKPLVTAVTDASGAFVLRSAPTIVETVRIKAIVTIDQEEWHGASENLRLTSGSVDVGDILVEKSQARRAGTNQNRNSRLPMWAGFFRQTKP